MLQVKRVMEKQSEEDLAKMILQQVIKNKMTILNLKETTDKVVSYLEANAILEMEDSDNAESSVI